MLDSMRFCTIFLMISRAISLSLLLLQSHSIAYAIEPSVIYDSDNRIELHEVKSSTSYFTARATIAFFKKDALQEETDGTTTVLGKTYGEENNLCPEERFYAQPAGAFCSGVLIAEDMVLTAGHCVDKNFCKNTRLAIDYSIDAVDRNPRTLRTTDILDCAEVVRRGSVAKRLDFALLRLKTKPPVNPVAFTKTEMTVGQEITLTGYPAGLPMKVVEGDKITSVGRLYAYAPLDAFGGSSGSPVVDSHSGDLLGILVGGEDDFEKAPKRSCQRVRKCTKEKCQGEQVLKISAIMKALSGGRD